MIKNGAVVLATTVANDSSSSGFELILILGILLGISIIAYTWIARNLSRPWLWTILGSIVIISSLIGYGIVSGLFSRMGEDIGNKILFPAPRPSYNEKLPGLIWDIGKDGIRRPFLQIQPETATKYIIYFHGNGNDLGHVYGELHAIARESNVAVLGVEYPGYGVFKGNPTANGINAASDHAWNFLLKKGVKPSDIFFFGYSIGTGSACRRAFSSMENGQPVAGVILHAPYSSVHAIVSEFSRLGKWLIDNHWENDKVLEDSRADFPLLIIHGKKDEVIPFAHSERLMAVAKSKRKKLILVENASHAVFDFRKDILSPVKSFTS